MKLPAIKQFQQWLPMLGAGAFSLWTALLVAVSLFSSGNEAVPGRQAKHMPTMAAPAVTQDCVTMPDGGLVICDDTTQGGQQ